MKRQKSGLAALACGAVLLCAAQAGASTAPGTFNQAGNILIADQFNNRVIEIDRKGDIVWSWGLGPHDFSANSPLGVNDAERVGADTLMAATGIPPKVDPYCKKGCPDNRVLLVDPSGTIVWQYGQFGVSGSGNDQLNAPVQADLDIKEDCVHHRPEQPACYRSGPEEKHFVAVWNHGSCGLGIR